ncbi:MAG: hypothetical protein H7288_26145 [Kineosporiaceae bacterium]|nr:hypothetical protein [Aeromicrobium sp.]
MSWRVSTPRKKCHKRRRVPSWDEIMSGGKPEGEQLALPICSLREGQHVG